MPITLGKTETVVSQGRPDRGGAEAAARPGTPTACPVTTELMPTAIHDWVISNMYWAVNAIKITLDSRKVIRRVYKECLRA